MENHCRGFSGPAGVGSSPRAQVYVEVPRPRILPPNYAGATGGNVSWTHHQQPRHSDSAHGQITHQHSAPTMHLNRPSVSVRSPLDYRSLLLNLSEQYCAAARNLSNAAARSQADNTAYIQRYHTLIVSGLGCLEAVVQNAQWKRSPREDAILQLRYANLLFEETENLSEAENILTKGIAHCHRNRLVALRYSMQHLLVRVLCRSNSKAALKYLESAITESSSCQHVPWTYAFCFLKVSLLLANPQSSSTHAALQSLHTINTSASHVGDAGILTLSAVIEAIVQLRIQSSESRVEAQRALATARGHLNGFEGSNMVQLQALVYLLDLASSLSASDVKAATTKMHQMQSFLDKNYKDKAWRSSESFSIPIANSVLTSVLADSNGIFSENLSSQFGLSITWTRSVDTHLLGFLFSAAAAYLRDRGDGSKTHSYLQEGLRLVDEPLSPSEIASSTSLDVRLSRAARIQKIKGQFLIIKAFASLDSLEVETARRALTALKDQLLLLPPPNAWVLKLVSTYLSGTFEQIQGNFECAIENYSWVVRECEASPFSSHYYLHSVLSVLARFNILLTIRTSHSENDIQTHLDYLKAVFESSSRNTAVTSNPHLQSAYYLIRATFSLAFSSNGISASYHSPTIRPTKVNLQKCITIAKNIGNRQILAMALCFMNETFYTGIVGDQALNAAKSARECAKELRSMTLKAVAAGMVADTLEREGGIDEAVKMRKEALACAARMPKTLRRNGLNA